MKLILSILLVCLALPQIHALKHELHANVIYSQRQQVKQGACETCKDVVNDVQAYIDDAETQNQVVEWVDENVCSQLPGDLRETCMEEAPILVQQAVDMVEQVLDAEDLCSFMGACSNTLINRFSSFAGFPLECPLCKLVAETLIQRLKKPDTREEMEENALAACEALDTQLARDKCAADVKQLFDSIDAVLDDVDPKKACEVGQFCSSSDSSVVDKPTMMRFVELKQLAQKLSDIPLKNDDETCQTCKAIVQQTAAVLEDPETQKEILDYAREGCGVVSSYQEECTAYVNQYGPLAIGMAISYLQPQAFCTRMGYCQPVVVS